ncbi:MAG: carbon-nitrogen hydrolase family protein [Planctomycetota bacterium]|nr:MAG: carbon-nitrogen hydrolase family protein [Planctomycetota bacterium]
MQSFKSRDGEILRVALAQMAPVWLDRAATLDKMLDFMGQAVKAECQLVVFGEALLPGYPFWLERTDGARFNSPLQKEIHARYLQQAVQIEAGHLEPLRQFAKEQELAIYFGCMERAGDRGGHSLYCSLVHLTSSGQIASVHRKLMPTYEERLSWAQGDGHGLKVHRLGAFTVGGLNCWENWLPLARAALYGQGENLHVAVWPGGRRLTEDITRFIARESRSFVISVSGLMGPHLIPDSFPQRELLQGNDEEWWADGGSCLANPDGSWLLEPLCGQEKLMVAELDYRKVLEERHNLDPAGHYSRPDVLQLRVNRQRQSTVALKDA